MQIYFVSLGCDKNLVDSEVMLGIINDEGYEVTLMPEQADVIIINTCGFIADAANESIANILELSEYKKTGKLKTLIVAGCMVTRYKEEVLKELPEVDAIVGSADFDQIAEIIKKAHSAQDGEKIIQVSSGNKPRANSNNLNRMIITPRHFAYLKIAEGCDNSCTYCTIPSIRGPYRSADMPSLLEESEMLASKGVLELILVAQDTALYGTDLYGKNMFHELIRKISEIDGIKRIRILYCYPEHITDETIAEMAANPKVCHYLDMPVQHADDKILKLMGRRSTQAKLRNVISKLRGAMPDIVLRTTIIVGFPGEGEKEFQNLIKFLKDASFEKLGVFMYSKEEGTPAYKLPGQVKENIKKIRKDGCMKVQQHISAARCKSYMGQVLETLVDGRIPEDDVYCGRGYMDSPDIDGMIFFKSPNELITGEFVKVKITDTSAYDLIGEEIIESGE